MSLIVLLLSVLAGVLPGQDSTASESGSNAKAEFDPALGSTLGWSAALASAELDGSQRPLLVLGDRARNTFYAVRLGETEPLAPAWTPTRLFGERGENACLGSAITALPDSAGRARSRVAIPFYERPTIDAVEVEWWLGLVDVDDALAGRTEAKFVALGPREADRAFDVFVRSLSEDLGLETAGSNTRVGGPVEHGDRIAVLVSTGYLGHPCRTRLWIVAADGGTVLTSREFEGDSFTAGEPVTWVPDLDGDGRPDLALGLSLQAQERDANRLVLLRSTDLAVLHEHRDPAGTGRVFGAAVEYAGQDRSGALLLAVGAAQLVRPSVHRVGEPPPPSHAAVHLFAIEAGGARLRPVAACSPTTPGVSDPALAGVLPRRFAESGMGWTAASGVAHGERQPWIAVSDCKAPLGMNSVGSVAGYRVRDDRWERWLRVGHRTGTPRMMEWDFGYRIHAFAHRDAAGELRRFVVVTTGNPTLREARVVVLDGDNGNLLDEYCVLD